MDTKLIVNYIFYQENKEKEEENVPLVVFLYGLLLWKNFAVALEQNSLDFMQVNCFIAEDTIVK